MNLVDLLDATAARQPQHLALVGPDEGASLTYAALKALVDDTAATLAHLGVQRGHCVGLHCPSGRDTIRLTYALWRLGACVVPIPSELSAEEKLRVCQGIALDGLLLDRPGKAVLAPAQAAEPQRVDELCWFAPARRFRERPAGFDAVNAAFIRFTSGTTGSSKGVVLSHETIRDRIDAANEALRLSPDDTVLWLLSMSYHFAVSIVAYLSFGATIVLARTHFARPLLDACRRHGVTFIYGAPMHYELMARDPGAERLPGLRLAISTTIALKRDTVDAFHRRFGVALSQALGVIELGLPCIDLEARPDAWGSVGRVLPAFEVSLPPGPRDAEPQPLRFRGKGMFDAYYEPWRPRAEVAPDGWFDTGDLGVLDEAGTLFIKGRKKELVNVAGMKLFPLEVEAALNALPGVQEACVFAHGHELFGEVPWAQVVRAPGSEVDEGTLKAQLARALAPYKVPDRITFVPALARTASGKLIRDERRLTPAPEERTR